MKRSCMFLSALSLVIPMFASALPAAADEPGPPPPVPSYAEHTEHIEGRIEHIEGKFTLRLHDVHGYIDHVRMHQGTIINPIGLTLVEGMQVRIFGRPGEHEFFADEIETPYHYAAGAPYYPPPYGYPYVGPYVYGPGYGYGYGPGFGTNVIIENRGHYWRR
jgi:hypothetical protein